MSEYFAMKCCKSKHNAVVHVHVYMYVLLVLSGDDNGGIGWWGGGGVSSSLYPKHSMLSCYTFLFFVNIRWTV